MGGGSVSSRMPLSDAPLASHQVERPLRHQEVQPWPRYRPSSPLVSEALWSPRRVGRVRLVRPTTGHRGSIMQHAPSSARSTDSTCRGCVLDPETITDEDLNIMEHVLRWTVTRQSVAAHCDEPAGDGPRVQIVRGPHAGHLTQCCLDFLASATRICVR